MAANAKIEVRWAPKGTWACCQGPSLYGMARFCVVVALASVVSSILIPIHVLIAALA